MLGALIATAFSWNTFSILSERENLQHFDKITRNAEKSIAIRLLSYQDALQGTVGYINGSEFISQTEWEEYTKALDIKKRYPGILGIGYIANVPNNKLKSYLEHARKTISSNFQLKLLGGERKADSEHFIIQYLSPKSINKAALGVDIASEKKRRLAAEISRDTGNSQLTGVLRLVQDQENKPGFLLLLPVYSNNTVLNSIEARRKALKGWVYAPFKGGSVFKDLPTVDNNEAFFSIYDNAIDNKNLIYQSAIREQQVDHPRRLVREFKFSGRDWIIVWESTKAFKQTSLEYQANFILVLGLLLSSLLGGLLILLNNKRDRAVSIVETTTKQLVETNDQLQTHTDYWRVLAEISKVAEKEITNDEFINFCLKIICEHMRWPLAHLYQWDESQKKLSPSKHWFPEVSNQYEVFRCITMQTFFSCGEGLPGRVLESRKPLWIPDVTAEANFPRAQMSTDIGIRAAFAFPISIQGKVIAVLECFLPEPSIPPENALSMIEQIGIHIGHILERRETFALLLHQNKVLEFALEGIAQLDSHGCYLSVNKMYASLAGYEQNEMIGMSWEETVAPNEWEHMRHNYQIMLAEGKVSVETVGVKKDGSFFFKRVVMITNHSETGTFLGSYCFMNDITEIKEIEKIIRESAIKFQAIFHQSFQFIGLLSPDGMVLEANRSALQACGLQPEDVIGKVFWETPWWSHSVASQEQLKKAIIEVKERGFVRFEATHPAADGSIITVDFSLKAVRDDKGEVILLIPEGRDISDKKMIEDALRASEEQFRNSMEYASIGMALVSPEGRFLKVNQALCNIVGYSSEELVQTDFQTITHPEDLYADLVFVQKILNREIPSYEIEKRYIHKNGNFVWILLSVSLIWSHEGLPLHFVAQMQDITKRKMFEQQILDNETRFRLVTEKVKDYAILMLDPEGYIKIWNIGAKRIKGYSANEILGQHFSIFYTQEAKEAHHPERELEHAKNYGSYEEEGWRVRKNGSCFWASVVITALFDDENKLLGFSKITRDLTERKFAEEQLEKAKSEAEQSAKFKSAFLANMSHEIRTPINGVLGLTEILLETSLVEEQRYYLSMIQSSGKILLTIINDILDFSKIEAGKIQIEETPFKLREDVNEIIAPFIQQSQNREIEIRYQIDSRIPDVLIGDINRIRQILNNLISNALKFTEKGEITLGVHLIQHLENNLVLDFWVQDTGIGLSEEQQHCIFEPFIQADNSTSRKYGGTGLGLSIVKNLVTLMNGKLWVESNLGQGSSFHFVLEFMTPYVGKPALAEVNFAGIEPPQRPLQILLAEDITTNQIVATAMLQKMGHTITLAQNGKQVLELLEKQHFDLILMDMLMPEMDGLEATRCIRQLEMASSQHIPIIALTANALESDKVLCLQAGMDSFVSKPFNKEALFNAIQSIPI